MLVRILAFIGVFIMSIALHELGHWHYAKHIRAKVRYKFPFRVLFSAKGLSKDDHMGIYEVGILYGFIWILCATFYDVGNWITLIIYLVCCGWDFKQMGRILKIT